MRKPLKVLPSNGVINECADLRTISTGRPEVVRRLAAAEKYAHPENTFRKDSLPYHAGNPYIGSSDRSAIDEAG